MEESVLYKYLGGQRIEKFIKERQLRFTQLQALNDPFESSVLLQMEVEDVVKAETLEEMKAKRKQQFPAKSAQIDTQFEHMQQASYYLSLPHVQGEMVTNYLSSLFGILSLSRNHRNMLMWSHYADSHTGFVVALDENHSFFSDSGREEFNPPLKRVTYRHNRKISELPTLDSLYCEKSLDWAYEEEERLFKDLEICEKQKSTCAFDCSIYLHEVPLECIKEIYFGANMKEEQCFEYRKLISESMPNVSVYRASISPEEYSLNFTEL